MRGRRRVGHGVREDGELLWHGAMVGSSSVGGRCAPPAQVDITGEHQALPLRREQTVRGTCGARREREGHRCRRSGPAKA